MTPADYLNAFRRRWPVIVGALLVAIVASLFVSTNPRSVPASATSYRAKVTLLQAAPTSGFSVPGINNLQTIAALVTIGEVPNRVARALGSQNPSGLTANVTANAEGGTGFLVIEARGPTAPQAERLASAFADELIKLLEERKSRDIEEEVQALTARIRVLQRQIRQGPPEQRGGLTATLQQLGDRREQLRSIVPDSGLEVIDRSRAEAIGTETIQAPAGRRTQVLAAALIGLILGIGLAVVLERFDIRIRTKHGAERHFTFPVVAEIPLLPRAVPNRLVMHSPKSPQANAFRLLAAVMTGHGDMSGEPDGNGGRKYESVRGHPTPPLVRSPLRGGRKEPPRVILVISAGPREGKTTVVANLAAAFAEGGKTVTVVSCDLRHPAVHIPFGVPNEHGLTEALRDSAPGRVLNGHFHSSQFAGVAVVPTGSEVDRPGELLGSPRLGQALAEAKRLSDVVLVDSAPLLTATESIHLVGLVDAVLVVARAGRVTPEVAQRTGEVLRRLGAPVAGVALTFARETAMPVDRWLPLPRWPVRAR